jgi:hypothetical protein
MRGCEGYVLILQKLEVFLAFSPPQLACLIKGKGEALPPIEDFGLLLERHVAELLPQVFRPFPPVRTLWGDVRSRDDSDIWVDEVQRQYLPVSGLFGVDQPERFNTML